MWTSDAANTFDDIVMWQTQYELMGGSGSGTCQAAF